MTYFMLVHLFIIIIIAAILKKIFCFSNKIENFKTVETTLART